MPIFYKNYGDKKLRILIDSGSTRTFVKSGILNSPSFKVDKPTTVRTMHGISEIKTFKKIIIFNTVIQAFEIPNTNLNDIILGYKDLVKMKAVLNFGKNIFTTGNNNKLYHNFTFEDENEFKNEIVKLIKTCTLQTTLPYNTEIRAEIRTTDNEPVYKKSYPYQWCYKDFVETEIQRLLDTGIIRNSKSPYNAPIHIVNNGKKLRLVIDFKKLNDKTIADRYPIPEQSLVLNSFGTSTYFSTIDLESGFHQIRMKEEDIEKTAFSINNAKYEFVRLPFGLKNAPSIFQRTLDDILREHIGKFCYIYMDDVIIFSKTKQEHAEHIKIILNKLKNSNMTISDTKSVFFAKEVEYLGHIVGNGQIKISPKKIEVIRDYMAPENIRQLRSFLGLANFYRKFIYNYADKAKPLTLIGKDHPNISKHKSAKTKIKLNTEQLRSFEILKKEIQNTIELTQPNTNIPFELTTDASDTGIGAVLSQNNKPIVFISKTLNDTERRYATNEREAYAIVWALQNLKNYLYGRSDTIVLTDHQPITFSIKHENPNNKLRRWYAFMEECGVTLRYKPGKENVVADALSRQYQINANTIDNETIHSNVSSPAQICKRTSKPINEFKRQIFIEKANNDLATSYTVLNGDRSKFVIKFQTHEFLKNEMKKLLGNNLNAIHSSLEILEEIKDIIKNTFSNYKFIHTTEHLQELTKTEIIDKLIRTTHERAHRGIRENIAQILEKYYFINMSKLVKIFVKNCKICSLNKYERHPNRVVIGEAPIPTKGGEQLHI